VPSEGFIADQAMALQQYAPVFAGRSVEGLSPGGSTVIAMDGISSRARAAQIVLRNQSVLAERLRPLNPRLIHAQFGVEGVYAIPLAKRLGLPLITTFRGFDATTTTSALLRSRKPSWVNYALLRHRLMKEGNLFLCVSDYIRDRLLEIGFPEDRTMTHYTGIAVDQIKPVDDFYSKNTILHVARLVEKKGTLYLLHAFAKVLKEVPDAELVIIGDGPLRPELEELTLQLGIASQVRFLGVQKNSTVMDWMGRARIFVLPSIVASSGDSEGLPTSAKEAAARALPIVATQHSGFPELINDGTSGFLVPERDASLLAQRLIELLNDQELCRKLGLEARKAVEFKFNIVTQTAKLEAMYGALV